MCRNFFFKIGEANKKTGRAKIAAMRARRIGHVTLTRELPVSERLALYMQAHETCAASGSAL